MNQEQAGHYEQQYLDSLQPAVQFLFNSPSDGDHTWFIGEILSAHVAEGYDRERTLIYWAGEFRTIGELIRGR
jgi:hypothetical protein